MAAGVAHLPVHPGVARRVAVRAVPREALRGVLAQLDELGYAALAAVEYEIRLRDGDDRRFRAGSATASVRSPASSRYIARLVPALDALGVALSAIDTEAGPGLLELNIAAREGLQAADDAAFVKLAAKEVAASLGLQASFLAKTQPGQEGSSGHVHRRAGRATLTRSDPMTHRASFPIRSAR